MADASVPADKHCSHCKKSGSEQAPLKRCTRCRSAWYCNRDCQKADWKTHRKTCGSKAQAKVHANAAAESTSTQGPHDQPEATANPPNPTAWDHQSGVPLVLNGIGSEYWLHNRPEKEVFKLLIDTYRMRIEDEYRFAGKVEDETLYGGAADDGVSDFRQFLTKVEHHRGWLPDWWSPAKTEECVRFATPSNPREQKSWPPLSAEEWELRGDHEDDDWSNLGFATMKHDINDHYRNPMMAMQMRMFGEKICGIGPWKWYIFYLDQPIPPEVIKKKKKKKNQNRNSKQGP